MKFITAKNHKKLYIVPVIVTIICLFLIFVSPGVYRGIDLKGGNQLIIRYDGETTDTTALSNKIKSEFNLMEVNIKETHGPTGIGLIIEYSENPDVELAKSSKDRLDFINTNIDDLKKSVADILLPLKDKGFLTANVVSDIEDIKNKDDLKTHLNENIVIANNVFNNSVVSLVKSELKLTTDARIQTREVSATLGKDFIRASINVGLIAFILLSIVILLFFREIIPSGLIIFAASFDILVALAGMALLDLPLSLTTIPALLMLIGYSVDTDILLSTKLLKNKTDDVYTVANKSMATGLTMTITTLATVLVMIVISYFTQMIVILEIATILFFGLLGDLVSTWFFNAPALVSYVQYKNKNKN